MESIAVSARRSKMCAFCFSINRLQKQDSVVRLEEDTDKKSNYYFVRLNLIVDRILLLIPIFIYINLMFKTFFNDIKHKYELLDVDEYM